MFHYTLSQKWKNYLKMVKLFRKTINFFKEVKDILAMIYATLIIKGKKTLEQVPSIIRSEVEELLEVLLED